MHPNAILPWQQRHVKPCAKVSSKIKRNLSRTSRASSDSCMSLRRLAILVLLLAMHLPHSTDLPEDWICIWGRFFFLNFDGYSDTLPCWMLAPAVPDESIKMFKVAVANSRWMAILCLKLVQTWAKKRFTNKLRQQGSYNNIWTSSGWMIPSCDEFKPPQWELFPNLKLGGCDVWYWYCLVIPESVGHVIWARQISPRWRKLHKRVATRWVAQVIS